MKKKFVAILLLVLVLVLGVALVLGACTTNPDKGKTAEKILVVAPDGAPAFAMAQLFLEKPQFEGAKVEYRVVSASALSGLVTTGEADIAILPSNMGANLYNKGEDLRLVGATTFGVMYIVSKDDSIKTLSDLQGKDIVSIGQGNVPEFVLRYVLEQNNIKANITFNEDGSAIIGGLLAGKISIGVLGEPAATGAVGKAKAKIVVNLQEEWQKLTGEAGYPQSALFARGKIATNYNNILEAISAKIANSATWVAANFEAANNAVKAAGGLVTLPAAAMVARCNLGFVKAKDGKVAMQNYLQKMLDFNAKLVGNKLPDDGFYL